MKPGPNPIKVFSASIDATLKFQPIREGWSGLMANLIGWNFSVASIEAEQTFIGLGPELQFKTSSFSLNVATKNSNQFSKAYYFSFNLWKAAEQK